MPVGETGTADCPISSGSPTSVTVAPALPPRSFIPSAAMPSAPQFSSGGDGGAIAATFAAGEGGVSDGGSRYSTVERRELRVGYEPPAHTFTQWQRWRGVEWLALGVCLYLVPLIIGSAVRPWCRDFELSDPSISYPFTEREIFPNWTLGPIILGPIVLAYAPAIFFISGRAGAGTATSDVRWLQWMELNAWALYHLISVGITFTTINVAKVAGGRLRPDFVDRLRRAGIVVGSPPSYAEGYSQHSVCETRHLQSNHTLRDGHLSFPSGHSGCAFAAMVPLCLFLFTRLRPFHHQSLCRLLICLAPPLTLAWVVALSRVQDFRHNYSDIIAGGIIGVAAALIPFRLYFSQGEGGGWEVKEPHSLPERSNADAERRGGPAFPPV